MFDARSADDTARALTWGLLSLTDAHEVDRLLRDHARRRARDDYEIAVLLRHGYLLRVHELGGFGSFREYTEQLFDFTGRQTEERLRTADALEELPALTRAFSRGELRFSAVRELTRVCTGENEEAWIAAARDKKAREVERMVSGRSRGALPDGELPPETQMHRMTLLSASSYALWQEARRAMVRETGGSVTDDEVVAMMARRVLGGSDEGRSNYQIGLILCELCRRATQGAGGHSVTVEPAVVEAARCDAQEIGRVDGAKPPRAKQKIPPATRRAVIARQEHRCAVPGCAHTAFLDLHHTKPRSEGGDHDGNHLVALCPAHHARAHDGKLVARGSFAEGFTFEHADGRRYGSPSFDAGQAEAFAQGFAALRAMGFKETEARAIIDATRPHVRADVRMPELLRELLRRAPARRGEAVRESSAEYVRLVA